jgi:LysR family cyn operon transcriptional activator
MENDLGAKLFHRSPSGLKLSEAGKTFLPFAHRISSAFETARSAISELGLGTPRGLRIGVSITASMQLVPGNLQAFHKRYPDVLINVTRAAPKQLLAGLENDQFDLCFGLELPESALVKREEVFSTRMAGFSASSFGVPKHQTLDQFCKLPLILPPRSCGTRTLLEDALKRSKIRARVIMEVDDMSTIVALVKAGVAGTILPRILPSLSKSLVHSEITDFIGEVKGVLLYPKSPTPEAQHFMEIASERIKMQTEWKFA